MSILAVVVALTLAAGADDAAAPKCPGETTLEMNQCQGAVLDAADLTLAKYVKVARAQIAKNSDNAAETATTLKTFDAAEAAWAIYRKAECDAVYDNWIEGTIRNAMALTCEIDLTVRHTHTVWSNWLTYMDDTPPVLPEPPKEAPE